MAVLEIIAHPPYNQGMVDLAGEVLILTGPPGSGKTTTAKALAREPGSSKVHLHADDFWRCIKNGAVAPYQPEAHEVVIDVLTRTAQGYANGGYFVILDGIIGPWFLLPFKTLTMPVHYVVLRLPLDVAIQRCRERGGDTLTDPAPITALHRQLSSLEKLERHVLSTAGHSPDETLSEVIRGVHNGTFRLL